MKLVALSAILVVWTLAAAPSKAAPFSEAALIQQALPNLVEPVQARRGVAVRGPRGGVAVARPGYRSVPAPVRPGWTRPASYWWRPGAAIAAGAALGFVTAAAATAYATSPAPAAGYCWYYTNPQRTQGFWDVCPR
ncbi:hypothetical protein MHY87_07945 [Microvirga sp. ACRRW]|uniref:hypothetical protein n=1 Tax=Microvirga sp. ACRRW TaxID=2918205 RepID=UPI001EF5D886|nr:hypothetical protein [Microvirga sp. ACRRW]MCG7392832.1 hypothetical protein [Microvirga sp. ACRRW]